MQDSEKRYTIGKAAEAAGLTVRTLQYYDSIGLMPSSGRTEGGRRYYTQSDMLRLSQIIFYKSVGIKLSDIRDKLPLNPSAAELEDVFSEQLLVLLRKIDALHFAMSVLNSSLEIIKSGKEPPIEMLSDLIRAVDGSSLADWTDFSSEAKLGTAFEQSSIGTLSGALDFYHTMRELMTEAAALSVLGTPPDSPAALELGRRWLEDILLKVAESGDEAAAAAIRANDNRETWPSADRTLFEQAEPFLEAAFAAYTEANNISLPESMSGGSTND